MRLVSTTTNKILLLGCAIFALLFTANAQENSPYSRYGLGDYIPSQNVLNRGMGGISTGFVDYDNRYDLKTAYPKYQSVNYLNPASYAKLRITSFDLGFEAGSRTLRTQGTNSTKFTGKIANISYLQLGVPLNRKQSLGMNFGLRPVTRINYKLDKRERVSGIDSVRSLFEGTGGSYEVFTGLGKSFKNLSIGFNVGYFFGTKDYSTRKTFINDTVSYFRSNHQTKTSFGGLSLNAGIQYAAQLNKTTRLVLGARGNLRQKVNGRQDIVRETFTFDANGSPVRIDSVFVSSDNKGTIQLPASLGVGFTIERDDKWLFGADFSTANWSQYRFFGNTDLVQNTWSVRLGGQLTPDIFSKNYWSRATYRVGFNFGPDYVTADVKNGTAQDLSQYNITAGVGLPMRKNPYTNQFTYINLSFEYGSRGNKNTPLRENIFRVGLGLTLSDLWFIKRKYE